jgi:hypothetical protein
VGAFRSEIGAKTSGITGSTMLIIKPPHILVPTITSEQINLTYLRHNKKGKPIGKATVSFVFNFSKDTPMNQGTAGYTGNYTIDWTSAQKVKGKVVTVLHPIACEAIFNASSNSVTLRTIATQKNFANGGQITIVAAGSQGVDSAAGVLLANPTKFTILAKAGGIVPTS